MRKLKTIEELPMFADDKAIGEALLGPERAHEFIGQAALLEKQGNGFPPLDDVFGVRYVPAVKAFFDHKYGLTEQKPIKPSGAEGPWERHRRRA